MPEISIIIPALNEEQYIEHTLQSIKAQNTKIDFEVIVCDGGSKDNTVKIAKKYADRVMILKSRGIWRGRNEGAKNSSGKVLIFIDADTRVPTNYVDVIYAIMQDPDLAAVSCAFRFDEDSKMLKVVEDVSNKYLLLKGSTGKGELLGFNNAIKRELFFEVGGFPNAPLEDGALAKILRVRGKVVFLPTPTVTTSARRLKKAGILKSVLYYANLELLSISKSKVLKKVSMFKDYKAVR